MFFVYAFNITINYLINSFFWHLIVFFVSLDLSGSVKTNLVDLRWSIMWTSSSKASSNTLRCAIFFNSTVCLFPQNIWGNQWGERSCCVGNPDAMHLQRIPQNEREYDWHTTKHSNWVHKCRHTDSITRASWESYGTETSLVAGESCTCMKYWTNMRVPHTWYV